VNDTTSTPDDPDGRAPVATGPQAAAAAGQRDTGGGAGATPAPAERGVGAPPPAGDAGAPGAGGAVPPSPGVGPTAPTSARPAAAAPDSQTAQLRKPAEKGSAARPTPGAPGEVPVTAVPGSADATRPANRPTAPGSRPGGSPAPAGRPPAPAPAPAPGPVPGPGPAAAAPPPWHRMPGQDPSDRPQPRAPERPAGGLLDDGPTAFLEPPKRPAGSAGQAETSQPGTGGWSAVRAVRNRPPRQAALQLKRLDPWSVLKLALVLAVVLFFIWLVAVGLLFGVLDGIGVWDRLNGTYADLVSGEAPTGSPLISAGRVFGLAAVVGAINSLLFAVAVTVGAFVYNVSADLVGGIEVTLSERD
jgi:hypothetical protein